MAGRLSLLGAGIQKPIPPAGGDWWLAGGISAANCIAAYQAKGAASYAASKVNLVNAATYALTDGVSTWYPTWAAETGWTFDLRNSSGCEHLISTITPTSTWTVIFRYSAGASAGHAFGTTNDDNKSFLIEIYNGYDRFYQATGNATAYTQTAAGVFALAGVYGYRNGSLIATVADNQSVNYQYPFFVGCTNVRGSMEVNGGFLGDIYAIAFYNTTLTGTQIAALTTAMNAL